MIGDCFAGGVGAAILLTVVCYGRPGSAIPGDSSGIKMRVASQVLRHGGYLVVEAVAVHCLLALAWKVATSLGRQELRRWKL